MKRHLPIVALLSVFNLNSIAQQAAERRVDSLKIDSMRRKLSSLKDSARIDCLNSLSQKCIFFKKSYSPEDSRIGGDSMYKYALMANNEATKIGYKYGIANSFLNLVESYTSRGPKDSSYLKALKDSILNNYTRRALVLAQEIQNDDLLGRVHYAFVSYTSESKDDDLKHFKQAVYHYQKAGNKKMELEVTTYHVWSLIGAGNYDAAMEYADKCAQIAKIITPLNSWEHELVEDALVNMGDLFETGGDYETALDYYHQADSYAKKNLGWEIDIKFSELFYMMGKYDSAKYYWQNWKKNYDRYYFGHQAYGNTLLGKIYVVAGEYDKSLEMFDLSLNAFKKGINYDSIFAPGLANPLIYMGAAYQGKKNYKTALAYVKQGIGFAKIADDRTSQLNGYKFLSEIYHYLNSNDSAYQYLLKYMTLKDSVENKQFFWRLNNYKRVAEDEKKKAQMSILSRDNKIKDQLLKQETLVRNGLIAGLFGFILVIFFFLRSLILKRKNEKLKHAQFENETKLRQLENENRHTELQRQAAELEMQALRAQMNPHFIFNCLSAINRIILRNESKIASDYLTRFSRLIRMVLINSQKIMIPLDDELQMLRLYLDMERLRFKDSFDYTISFTNAIDTGAVLIPSLLLQPFCENAVWHGLMQKEGQGHLTIELSQRDNILHCAITDNGIGRERAGELKSKTAEIEKSMGLEITAQRLALLNRDKQVTTFFTIEDIMDSGGHIAGTRVILEICYKELIEELV